MIYLDNAATTLKKPQQVTDAVVQALNSMGNSGRGAHGASLDAARTIYDARTELAQFFGAEDPRRIIFTNNATESLNIAIKGTIHPGDHVITTMLEHNSVLRPLYEAEERGAELTMIPADAKGRISYEQLEQAIKPTTKAIVCTHGSNVTGNLIDIGRVGSIAAVHKVMLIVDASQTAGVFPIDVKTMKIDILCFTGHKGLLGPQGTGGMYVRPGVEVKPLKSGGSGVQSYRKAHPSEYPEALEAGTLNGHGISGLAAGVAFLKEQGVDRLREHEQNLMWEFYQGVTKIPGIKVYGDFETRERCPVVLLNIDDYDSSEVSDELLTSYGIATRPGAHCAPLMHEALGTVEQGAVRFSISYANTHEEIQEAIRALSEMAAE